MLRAVSARSIREQKTGKLADITCFSFHPRKVITTGEGGMAVTNEAHLAEEKFGSLKKYGMKTKEWRNQI